MSFKVIKYHLIDVTIDVTSIIKQWNLKNFLELNYRTIQISETPEPDVAIDSSKNSRAFCIIMYKGLIQEFPT